MSTPAFPSPVVYCALLPHAPILVPGVGGNRENDAVASISAMREAARRAIATKPDVFVVISPHSPRVPEAAGIWSGERLRGSLKAFGFPGGAIDLPADGTLASEIATLSARRGVLTLPIKEPSLDHGATVPLWFVAEAGWTGPTVVVGLSSAGQESHTALGEAIAEAAFSTGRRVALIASGDMSHRLSADAPCGFDPRGFEFDCWLLNTLRRGDYRSLLRMDPELEEAAAQDAVGSLLVAAGATRFSAAGAEVLNYEGPFGVGYGVVILCSDGSIPPRSLTTWLHC